MEAFFNLMQAGGFIMYPLLICSIATWVIAFERGWWMHTAFKKGKALCSHIENLLEAGHKERALEAAIQSNAPIARVYESVLKSDAKTDIEAKTQRMRMELNQEYRKYIWILGTIGSASPFLGLFGTVVGILRAFQTMAETGETGFSIVAASISEALIATAAGIIVAVIAVAFYNFFQVRAASLSLSNRVALDYLSEYWKRPKEAKESN